MDGPAADTDTDTGAGRPYVTDLKDISGLVHALAGVNLGHCQ